MGHKIFFVSPGKFCDSGKHGFQSKLIIYTTHTHTHIRFHPHIPALTYSLKE